MNLHNGPDIGPDVAKPVYVQTLEAVFGAPSQAAFGSAVFSTHISPDASLEQLALATYRYFVGELWTRYGEAAWMAPWQVVYTRPATAAPDIAAELVALPDHSARLSASLLLEDLPDPDANAALRAAFDDAAVRELVIYRIGDGAAMSGLLIAARRPQSGDAVLLILLMD